MAYVITPLQPLDKLGPGLTVQINSGFTGPIAAGSYWLHQLALSATPFSPDIIRSVQYDAQSVNFTNWTPFADWSYIGQIAGGWSSDGTTVFLISALYNPSNVVLATATISRAFDSQSGLGLLSFYVGGQGPAVLNTAAILSAVQKHYQNAP